MSQPADIRGMPPRFRLGRSALIGCAVFTIGALICGATGLCHTEYNQDRVAEGILIGVFWGIPFGLIAGLVFGMLFGIIRRWLWLKKIWP